jgi:tetratricopeptide (TPR) repeat protein
LFTGIGFAILEAHFFNAPCMQKSKLIYELVKSLSAPEKRYINRHLKLFREETNHAELFKALDLLEEYNPQVLKSKLGDSGAARNLDVAKVQLYDICLRYLRSYYESSNTDVRIQSMLGECRLLLNRGMHEHCRRRLGQVKIIAAKHFAFGALIEINDIEREILLSVPAMPVMETLLKLEQEEHLLFEQYSNYRFFVWAASHAAACSLLAGSASDKEAETKLHTLLKHELFSDESKAMTFPAKRLFYYTKAFYAHAFQNYQESIRYNLLQVELLESKSLHSYESLRSLVSAMYNLLIDYYATGMYEMALNAILRLRTLPERLSLKPGKASFLRHKLLLRVINMEFAVLTRMGRFESELIEWAELDETLAMLDEGKEMAFGTDLRFSAAHFCFGASDYKLALRYLNAIINEDASGTRMQMQFSARLLRLIIYRLANESAHTFEAMLRQTRRWVEDNKVTDSRQLLFMEFFEAEIRLEKNSPEHKLLLAGVRDKINQPLPEIDALVFDYRSWVESEWQQKTYAEIVKQKYELGRSNATGVK